jgi:hypothetical protein
MAKCSGEDGRCPRLAARNRPLCIAHARALETVRRCASHDLELHLPWRQPHEWTGDEQSLIDRLEREETRCEGKKS